MSLLHRMFYVFGAIYFFAVGLVFEVVIEPAFPLVPLILAAGGFMLAWVAAMPHRHD